MIAALYVQRHGVYLGVPGVDPWDVARDARRYDGPWPVVAHPPCNRWSRLAGQVAARGGAPKGDDAGCFSAALAAVRRWGGVLEHPAHSEAWRAFRLTAPPAAGGWVRSIDGGWVCHLEQGHYGHLAPKATWLYACGVDSPPDLVWGPSAAEMVVTTSRRSRGVKREMPKRLRSTTPPPFRDLLLSIAAAATPDPTVQPLDVRRSGRLAPLPLFPDL